MLFLNTCLCIVPPNKIEQYFSVYGLRTFNTLENNGTKSLVIHELLLILIRSTDLLFHDMYI